MSQSGDRAQLHVAIASAVPLFVHDLFNLRRFRSTCRFVVAAVMARWLPIPIKFLVAIVGFPDAVVLGRAI